MKTIPISFTTPEDLLIQIDDRAASLDLTRSQYLRKLSREEIAAAFKQNNLEAAKRCLQAAEECDEGYRKAIADNLPNDAQRNLETAQNLRYFARKYEEAAN